MLIRSIFGASGSAVVGTVSSLPDEPQPTAATMTTRQAIARHPEAIERITSPNIW